MIPATLVKSSKIMDADVADIVKIEDENQDADVENEDMANGLPLDLSRKVFGNDMLREIILRRVIFEPNGKLSRPDICAARAVQKSWLTSISDLLRKRREPLLQLTLKKDNSLQESAYCRENGKLLRQFLDTVAGPLRLDKTIPPFSLKIEAEFFRRENHKDLSDCLIKCGEGLVSCDLTFPMNSSMVLLFHSFTLPKLQRLNVQFSDHRLITTGLADGSILMTNHHTVYPLQTILNETSELQELCLRQLNVHGQYPHLIPSGFEYLNLPHSITRLLLDSPMRNSDLTLLANNDLPNLVQLRLFASYSAYDQDIIHEILKKYRCHLQILNLRGIQAVGPAGYAHRPPTIVRFPVMERLEVITITSCYWELEGEENIRWDKQLPALSELRLLQHSASSLRKWANTHALSASVTRLFVSLVNTNHGLVNPYLTELPAPLTLENMQGIHITMPFLTCLEITVCGEQTCALKYLFMEMRSLQKLAIAVKGASDNIAPVHWDALLIGLPQDVAASLRRNPSFWNNFELKDNNFPTIRNLTELRSLALVENFMRTNPGNEPEESLISDLVFHFAFLKMGVLKHMLLAGRFKPSTSMIEKWREEKGVPLCIHSMRRA